MKSAFTFLFLLIAFNFTFSQIITKEKRTEKDSTGKETTTEATIISTSEDITPQNNMIVINPLKFFLFYNLSYFHAFDKNVGGGIGFQLPTLGGIDGFGINAEIRVYPSQKSLRGFYIAPNISYNSLSTGGVTITPFSIGALIGWQWFPGDDFAIGLGLGIDYYMVSGSHEGNNLGSYKGSVPAVRFDIGYAW